MEIKGKTIKLKKELNELDKFLLKFLKILEKHFEYVIVSGYVALLFGRARMTEDIDILIKLEEKKFKKFWKEVNKNFYCLNAGDEKEALENLKEGISLRFSEKKNIIPNIEMKACKKQIEFIALNERIEVIINSKKIFISPIELQIAYKEEALKSEKDLEDALHLRKVFENFINEEKIKEYKKMIKHG